jgi:hypothetical protein
VCADLRLPLSFQQDVSYGFLQFHFLLIFATVLWFLYTLFYPLFFWNKKGEYFFDLDRNCIFKLVKWFLSKNSQRGRLLVCDWLHSVGQNHFYVKLLFNQGCCCYSKSRIHYVLQRRFCTEFKTVKSDPLHSFGCPSQLSGRSSVKQHPSGRRG